MNLNWKIRPTNFSILAIGPKLKNVTLKTILDFIFVIYAKFPIGNDTFFSKNEKVIFCPNMGLSKTSRSLRDLKMTFKKSEKN